MDESKAEFIESKPKVLTKPNEDFASKVEMILQAVFKDIEFWGDNGSQGEKIVLTDLPPW